MKPRTAAWPGSADGATVGLELGRGDVAVDADGPAGRDAVGPVEVGLQAIAIDANAAARTPTAMRLAPRLAIRSPCPSRTGGRRRRRAPAGCSPSRSARGRA